MIYTTYFAQIRKLPESITPIAISNTIPDGVLTLHLPQLAPDWPSIREYKCTGNRQVFREEYWKKLDALTLPRVLSFFPEGDIALVCYEKEARQCHRSLLAEWLRTRGGLEVEEWRYH